MSNPRYSWGNWFLSLVPWPMITVSIFLVVISIGLIIFVRWRWEGVAYNASAGSWADIPVSVCIAYAVVVLQRGRILPFTNTWWWNLTAIVAAIVVVRLVHFGTPNWRYFQIGDCVHDFIVLPLMVYLAVLLVPNLIWYGERKGWVLFGLTLILWVGANFYDNIHDSYFQVKLFSDHPGKYRNLLKKALPHWRNKEWLLRHHRCLRQFLPNSH